MKSCNEAFGQALRELRRDKNQSQESLAFDAGFDRTYISLLELGQKSPTLNTIMALCAAFDISLVQLASRVEAILEKHHD
jgi:transcriptional regulator with XRE-family HTH domain